MASEVIATIRSEHSVRRRAAFKLLYSIEAERNANRTEIARAHDKLRDTQCTHLSERRQSFYRDYRDTRYNWTDCCCSSWCKGNPEEFNFLDDEYESLSDKHQIVSDNITSDQKEPTKRFSRYSNAKLLSVQSPKRSPSRQSSAKLSEL
jgi:hypothetical protein